MAEVLDRLPTGHVSPSKDINPAREKLHSTIRLPDLAVLWLDKLPALTARCSILSQYSDFASLRPFALTNVSLRYRIGCQLRTPGFSTISRKTICHGSVYYFVIQTYFCFCFCQNFSNKFRSLIPEWLSFLRYHMWFFFISSTPHKQFK